MPKDVVKCDWCGADLLRYPSTIKERNFCNRGCLKKHMMCDFNVV